MSADLAKLDWSAFDSAPEHYPMAIISSKLRYHGDPTGAGMPLRKTSIFHYRWGANIDLHLGGASSKLNPLPDKLDITFFSYLEDQFYRGSFNLPYDKILKLVGNGGVKEGNYYHFLVGTAPGGTVAVWVRNGGNKEVFFGQAKKVEMDFAKAFPAIPIAERTEYVKRVSNGGTTTTPAILADIRKNGIPFQTWANYRTLYNWVPTFLIRRPAGYPAEGFGLDFYNGEDGYFRYPFEQIFSAAPHPVPRWIKFRNAIDGRGLVYDYNIFFDEAEILEAFARLGAKQLPMQLEFDPKYPVKKTKIRLRNATEVITLEKTIVTDKY